jgi:Fic family protein
MHYESMKKIFLKSNDNGTACYKQRFYDTFALHFDFEINNYPAFLIINNEMANIINNIQVLNDKIDVENKFISLWIERSALIEEIICNNAIEGIVTTRKEIGDLIDKDKPKKYQRLYGIVQKYQKILSDDPFEPIISSQDLRELYDQSMRKDVVASDPHNELDGDIFRKEQVEVLSGSSSIHKGLYPESKIVDAMDRALNILNEKQYPLLIRVAVFHYLFGYIHPFYDGNGRMNRYVSSYYLKEALSPSSALQLSVACKNNQKKYYEGFKVTNDVRNRGDLTYFVLNFLEILEYGIKEFSESLKNKCEGYKHYVDVINNNSHIDDKEKIILRYLTTMQLLDLEYTTRSYMENNLYISNKTLITKLKKLEQLGYVECDKKGRSFHYNVNLDVLDGLA